MPLYLFRCPDCRATIEKLQAYLAPPPTCAHCFEAPMERIPAASTIVISDPPAQQAYRSREGFRVTTTDRRPRRQRY